MTQAAEPPTFWLTAMRNRKSAAPPSRPAPARVCVQHDPRGSWEVIGPERGGRIACATLEDARRVAYLSVGRTERCELIVRDAYNRVLQRELITSRRTPAAARRPRRSS